MRVLVAGDYVPFYRVLQQIEKSDYSCLDDVKQIIQSVDYSIVNLEAPIVLRDAVAIEKTGPNLRCTEKAIDCIVNAGFKCLTLANNHFRDYGQTGVEDTINVCNNYGVDYVGGGCDIRESSKVLFKSLGNYSIAIINACESEWSIASDKYGGSNPLNVISLSRSIVAARKKANFVLVIIHGGSEHYKLPSPRMKEAYRFFIEQGADAVVNHHQHCYSGYEVYKGKPIFYGLGNFCFDNPRPFNRALWQIGYMVELNLDINISFVIYPYTQSTEFDSSVKLMKETTDFYNNLKKLNNIISNDELLLQSFENFAQNGIINARNILSPYSLRITQRLYEKKLLPSFVTKKRMRQLLAYIQCESHKDVLLHGLNQYL